MSKATLCPYTAVIVFLDAYCGVIYRRFSTMHWTNVKRTCDSSERPLWRRAQIVQLLSPGGAILALTSRVYASQMAFRLVHRFCRAQLCDKCTDKHAYTQADIKYRMTQTTKNVDW